MRMRIYFIFTFLFFYNLFSQGDDRNLDGDAHINYLPQAFIIQSLGSSGYSNTTMIDAFNIGNSNPASLSNFNTLKFGLSYQLESNIDIDNILYKRHKRIYNFLPQSIGMSFPINDIKVGIAYSQIYNSCLQYQPLTLLLITPENPEGTFETFHNKSETLITGFSILTAYESKRLFNQNNRFSIGIRLSIINTNRYDKIMTTEYDENYSGFNWSIGCLYRIMKGEKSLFNSGLFYEHSFSGKAKYDDSHISGIDALYYVTNLPSKLHFGVSGNILDQLQYLSNISYIFWESLPANTNNNIKNIENQFDISGNINYFFTGSISSAIGVYIIRRKFEEEVSNPFINEFSSFLIFGLTTYIRNIEISLILADSHLLSDDLGKQTILKIGTNVNL